MDPPLHPKYHASLPPNPLTNMVLMNIKNFTNVNHFNILNSNIKNIPKVEPLVKVVNEPPNNEQFEQNNLENNAVQNDESSNDTVNDTSNDLINEIPNNIFNENQINKNKNVVVNDDIRTNLLNISPIHHSANTNIFDINNIHINIDKSKIPLKSVACSCNISSLMSQKDLAINNNHIQKNKLGQSTQRLDYRKSYRKFSINAYKEKTEKLKLPKLSAFEIYARINSVNKNTIIKNRNSNSKLSNCINYISNVSSNINNINNINNIVTNQVLHNSNNNTSTYNFFINDKNNTLIKNNNQLRMNGNNKTKTKIKFSNNFILKKDSKIYVNLNLSGLNMLRSNSPNTKLNNLLYSINRNNNKYIYSSNNNNYKKINNLNKPYNKMKTFYPNFNANNELKESFKDLEISKFKLYNKNSRISASMGRLKYKQMESL